MFSLNVRAALATVAAGAAFTAMLSGCSTLRIASDWDHAVDFTGYRSYRWAPTKAGSEFSGTDRSLLDRRIRRAVDVVMTTEKGFRLAPPDERADLLLVYRAKVRDRVDVYHDYAFPRRWGPRVSVHQYQEGTLSILMVDPALDQVVWQGWALGVVQDRPEESERKIRKAVAKLLERYPPEVIADVASIESASFRAWPAREEMRIGGWVLRFADGYTRRPNSVNPLADCGCDPEHAIDESLSQFRARGLRPVFKMTPAVQPSDLDRRLEDRGFPREGPTRVQTRCVVPPPGAGSPATLQPSGSRRACAAAPPSPTSLTLLDRFDDRWLETFERWEPVAADRRDAHAAILRSIEPARRFAILSTEREPVAAGLAVADGSLVGLFDLVTAPGARRSGHGSTLVRGLLAWGAGEGARTAYLQVTEGNEAARALYHRLGFRDAYPYWYRAAPEASGRG